MGLIAKRNERVLNSKPMTCRLWRALAVLTGVLWWGSQPVAGQVLFRKLHLENTFFCEGANVADFNRDGHLDVVSGPFWYAGPDFQKRHVIHEPTPYDPHGYSENFLTYSADFNGDSWVDILYVPWPGKDAFWFQNPGASLEENEQSWVPHRALTDVGNESPAWIDLNGDQRPELVFNIQGQLGYATWDPMQPDRMWEFHPISDRRDYYQRYTHGLGVGDLSGDGRLDVLESAGWWEQPHSLNTEPWIWHPYPFAEAGAQILVGDLNGDGLNDVVTSWHCHNYGLVWHEQIRRENGQIDFRQHTILSPTPDVNSAEFRLSQMHALAWGDINQDGCLDIVTGKRFWAHGPQGDAEPSAAAVLVWFESQKTAEGQVDFTPRLIDNDSGVGTQVVATDVNLDRVPDIVVGNKKGTFLFLSQPRSAQAEK